MPQLLEHFGSADEYNASVQEGAARSMEWEAEDSAQAEEEGYDPEEDGLPWSVFYAEYHLAVVIGQIECGRVVREARVDVWYAGDITFLDNCYLDEHGFWVNGRIRKEYDWGGLLGPPYGEIEDGGDGSGDE